MTDDVSQFNCPNCDALYGLVRIETSSVSSDRELVCLTCGTPLQSRDGRFILKYFLVQVGSTRRAGA